MTKIILYIVFGAVVLLVAESVYHLVLYSGEKKRMLLRRRLRSLSEPGSPSLLRERRMARSPGLDRFLQP